MKKILLYSIVICMLLILIKYHFSNYKIEYNVDNYSIKTDYKNNRFFFEIYNGNTIYNFDVYSKRNFSKTKIKNIKEINFSNYKCIYPVIKNIETYPLCYDENSSTLVDYNLIDAKELEEYKTESKTINKPNKNFVYYNNLSKNDFVALWTYKGYIIMNNNNYNMINLFQKDRYDNNLSYIIENTIYMPNYDEEYEYKNLVSLEITNQKISKIELDNYIDYDSYIVGNINNYLYIYDNKSSILYEINIKNGKTIIKGNNEIGFVKYENGKFISCSRNEYKNNKITFNKKNTNYNYEINESTYKSIKDNDSIKTKINDNEINVIYEKNNVIYYILEDGFYRYDPITGSSKIFYDYELTFNNTSMIYMYSK